MIDGLMDGWMDDDPTLTPAMISPATKSKNKAFDSG